MRKYELICLSDDELIEIAKDREISIEAVDADKGQLDILFDGDVNLWDELKDALKKEFNTENIYMFSSDGDQTLPDQIMLIIGYDEETVV